MMNGHILVVDDDVEDQLILLDYFKESGNDGCIKFAVNGSLALAYLDAVEEDEMLPRLIVMDLNMPILNGTQTLLEIKRRSRYKNIPVIIFSTSENENEKRKCLSFGALDYIVKPSTYAEGLVMTERFSSFLK